MALPRVKVPVDVISARQSLSGLSHQARRTRHDLGQTLGPEFVRNIGRGRGNLRREVDNLSRRVDALTTKLGTGIARTLGTLEQVTALRAGTLGGMVARFLPMTAGITALGGLAIDYVKRQEESAKALFDFNVHTFATERLADLRLRPTVGGWQSYLRSREAGRTDSMKRRATGLSERLRSPWEIIQEEIFGIDSAAKISRSKEMFDRQVNATQIARQLGFDEQWIDQFLSKLDRKPPKSFYNNAAKEFTEFINGEGINQFLNDMGIEGYGKEYLADIIQSLQLRGLDTNKRWAIAQRLYNNYVIKGLEDRMKAKTARETAIANYLTYTHQGALLDVKRRKDLFLDKIFRPRLAAVTRE